VRSPERAIAVALGGSVLAGLGLAVTYAVGGQPQVEGALLAVALGGIGIGLVVWAKHLLAPHEPQTEARPVPPTRPEGRAMGEQLEEGVEQVRRRRFLARMLIGAVGALGRSLFQTPWRAGMRLVTVDGTPVTRETLQVDSFTTVFPEGHEGSADGQAVLVRVRPGLLAGEGPALEGFVAYSKICTHAGCPLGLYLSETHELRCPCHQSTFDVLDAARPVYGPAARALPELPIAFDGDGALIALGDFTAPVGPAFWNLRS
jgi:ubiquinol-cytochrome c reductase iron-sulfur subunit